MRFATPPLHSSDFYALSSLRSSSIFTLPNFHSSLPFRSRPSLPNVASTPTSRGPPRFRLAQTFSSSPLFFLSSDA